MKVLLVCISFCLFSWASAIEPLKADIALYNRNIKPLINEYCVKCHGPKKSKGDMRWDTIDPDIISGEDRGKWNDFLEMFNTGEMPPEDEKQPTDQEREIISSWLAGEFKKARLHSSPNRTGNIRRMTRYELKYVLEDLFEIFAENIVHPLPNESQSINTGLKNSSKLLKVSGPQLETYYDVIFETISKVKRELASKPVSVSLNLSELNLEKPPQERPVKESAEIETSLEDFHDGVEQSGKRAIISSDGHLTLEIPEPPKEGLYNVSFKASRIPSEAGEIKGPGIMATSIGYIIPGAKALSRIVRMRSLGITKIETSESLQDYTKEGHYDEISPTVVIANNKRIYIRLTNQSSGPVYVESFTFSGNINSGLKAKLIDPSIKRTDQSTFIKQALASFMTKAFRSAPSKKELQKYYRIYRGFSKKYSELEALVNTYEKILCSPKFFYVGIPGNLSETQKKNYSLAEKISFLLWCSIPDAALLADAAEGRLTDSSVLKSHVQRMLKDEKSKRLVERFTDQWLDTSNLFNVAVDSSHYPDFKDQIKPSMKQETVGSINDVFRNGAPALDLLEADHVFVNQDLAKYYEIKGVSGPEFRKVKVEGDSIRGGLLTQATFLIGNSDGINSHAILRGVWLTKVLLNDPPPPPPKNVQPLDESIPGFNKMTLNQKMFAHRNNDACRNCHNKIDPWGIPFENFDASGSWRDEVLVISKSTVEGGEELVIEKNYLEVENKATLPSKDTVTGIKELKDFLVENRKGDFAKGLTEKLLSYALWRDVDFYDAEFVEDLNREFMASNFSIRTLIEEIVLSEQFQEGV